MTRLNELLGTEFPIVQGGMANIATAEFAAAVSNAGALGLIGGGGMDAAGFRESIRRCRTLTDRPFGVNIMLMHPQAEEMADIAAEERVAVITTGAGNPARFIPRWKESGAKVFADMWGRSPPWLWSRRFATRWASRWWPPEASRTPVSSWRPMLWEPAAPRWAPACW